MESSILIWVVIIILQIADALTTWKVLLAGGREQNPAMLWIISKIGLKAALIESKAIIIAVTGVTLLIWPVFEVHLAMFLLSLWYGWVVWHNAQEMKK